MAPNRLLPVALLAAALTVAGCGRREPQPNVLVITMDTTRADHLSPYGYRFATTPYLERFAAEGTLFRHAYASAPATAPSHATIFTSLAPLTHRVLKNAMTLGESFQTLAETLGQHDYQTAAVVSSFVLNRKFGLSQGFGFYDDDLSKTRSTVPTKNWEGEPVIGKFDCRADATTDRASDWLENARDPAKPFFLFVHYFDPHAPYSPPKDYQEKFTNPEVKDGGRRWEISSYDGEIAFTDAQIGRLMEKLAALGLADNTLVVITADHGEGLWQHGYQYHGAQIYEESVHVPLLMRWPGHVTAGGDVAAPVTVADIMPTVLELTGTPADGLDCQGLSLAAAATAGGALDPERPVFLYRVPYEPHEEYGTWVAGEKFGVRRGRWKFMVAEQESTLELYDLQDDPGETRNLASAQPALAAELAGLLADWREVVTLPDSLSVRPELSDADRRKLHSLGYAH